MAPLDNRPSVEDINQRMKEHYVWIMRALRLLIIFLLLIFAFAFVLLAVIRGNRDKGLSAQIASLNETERSLENVLEYVREQQAKVKDSEDVLKRLQSEQERLQPVVETNREVVDAVMTAYAERASINVWWERGIGFVSGTLASMLATLLCLIAGRSWLAKRLKPFVFPPT